MNTSTLFVRYSVCDQNCFNRRPVRTSTCEYAPDAVELTEHFADGTYARRHFYLRPSKGEDWPVVEDDQWTGPQVCERLESGGNTLWAREGELLLVIRRELRRARAAARAMERRSRGY